MFIYLDSPAWLPPHIHHLLVIIIQLRFRVSSSHNLIYFWLQSMIDTH